MSLRRTRVLAGSRHPPGTESYERAFLRDVFQLLERGWLGVRGLALADAEENDITGELCFQLEELRWEIPFHGRYEVHEEQPQRGGGLRGSRRARVDIVLAEHAAAPRRELHVEAKRLRDGQSLRSYFGADGLGCFLSGRYARGQRQGAMLGYVQIRAPEKWMELLGERLGRQAAPLRARPPACLVPDLSCVKELTHARSEHDRDGEVFTVHHLLMDFRPSNVPSR